MFTLFHLFYLIGLVAGFAYGSDAGHRFFGWPGAIAGAAAGLVLGHYAGRLPLVLSWRLMRRDHQRCETATLKARLQTQYFISHLIIAELVLRGEPLEQFRDYVASLVTSESADRRRFGEQTARLWFPDLLPSSGKPSTPTASSDPGKARSA